MKTILAFWKRRLLVTFFAVCVISSSPVNLDSGIRHRCFSNDDFRKILSIRYLGKFEDQSKKADVFFRDNGNFQVDVVLCPQSPGEVQIYNLDLQLDAFVIDFVNYCEQGKVIQLRIFEGNYTVVVFVDLSVLAVRTHARVIGESTLVKVILADSNDVVAYKFNVSSRTLFRTVFTKDSQKLEWTVYRKFARPIKIWSFNGSTAYFHFEDGGQPITVFFEEHIPRTNGPGHTVPTDSGGLAAFSFWSWIDKAISLLLIGLLIVVIAGIIVGIIYFKRVKSMIENLIRGIETAQNTGIDSTGNAKNGVLAGVGSREGLLPNDTENGTTDWDNEMQTSAAEQVNAHTV